MPDLSDPTATIDRVDRVRLSRRKGNLMLTRHRGDGITIIVGGVTIQMTITRTTSTLTRIAFEADSAAQIFRTELLDSETGGRKAS